MRVCAVRIRRSSKLAHEKESCPDAESQEGGCQEEVTRRGSQCRRRRRRSERRDRRIFVAVFAMVIIFVRKRQTHDEPENNTIR